MAVVAASDYNNVVFQTPFEGTGGGTDAVDESNNANTINFVSGATLITSGDAGAALPLFGNTTFMDVNSVGTSISQAAGEFDIGTQDFTFEMWVYNVGVLSNEHFFGVWGDDATNVQLQGRIGTTGRMEIFVSGDGGASSTRIINAVYSSASNAWTHFALQRSGTDFTLWRGGVVLDNVTDSTDMLGAGAPLELGHIINTNKNPLNGFIGPTRFVIAEALYPANTNFTPPDDNFPLGGPPLIAEARQDATSLQTLYNTLPAVHQDGVNLQSLYNTLPLVQQDGVSLQILRSLSLKALPKDLFPQIRHVINTDLIDPDIFAEIVPLPPGHPDNP